VVLLLECKQTCCLNASKPHCQLALTILALPLPVQ
jgi:hypothetical protein